MMASAAQNTAFRPPVQPSVEVDDDTPDRIPSPVPGPPSPTGAHPNSDTEDDVDVSDDETDASGSSFWTEELERPKKMVVGALDGLSWPHEYSTANEPEELFTWPLQTRTILRTCDICHLRVLSPTEREELMNCGHYVCRTCLFQLLILYLLSPKSFQQLLCCGEADILRHRGIVVRAYKDRALASLINIVLYDFRRGQWTCSRGHPPRGGSLTVTRTDIPVWQLQTKCSGCVTHTNREIQQDAEEAALGKGYFFHQICVFCREETGIVLGGCKCGWMKPIFRLLHEVCVPSKNLGRVLSVVETLEKLLGGTVIASTPYQPDGISLNTNEPEANRASEPGPPATDYQSVDGNDKTCAVCYSSLLFATPATVAGRSRAARGDFGLLGSLPGRRVRCLCGATVCRDCGKPVLVCECDDEDSPIDDEEYTEEEEEEESDPGPRRAMPPPPRRWPQRDSESVVARNNGYLGKARSTRGLPSDLVSTWVQQVSEAQRPVTQRPVAGGRRVVSDEEDDGWRREGTRRTRRGPVDTPRTARQARNDNVYA
ncbi:hypothetical protein QBC47DRAFT_88766 [Echria macrotheca]|uniref:RING-type domain-containing protein n=1 Tax=Echria macrotheca TaxID=438768 RepID=A0AAJ0B398_9PEZI|nr:hypothetical protein QBC47DRAFT_88766 [Echria macrotheca]